MKQLLILGLLFSVTACEYATMKYGYLWNPLKVLQMAESGLKSENPKTWSSLLSGQALCLYGTRRGYTNLKQTLQQIDETSLREPVLSTARYLDKPTFIGYVAYYQKIYHAEAFDQSGLPALKVTILCHYGRSDSNERWVRVPVKNYHKRSCSISRIENFLDPLESDICR
jgi:hypothetical protein